MPETTPVESNRLSENIVHFARLLRAVGLPVGPGHTLDAVRAVEIIGIGNREEFHAGLSAVFVNRREHREIFDQAFHIFWRNPKIMDRMLGMMLPTLVAGDSELEALSRRLSEAMRNNRSSDQEQQQQVEFDASLSASHTEVLQQKDFEQMSVEEIAVAKKAIARLRLPHHSMPTRRFEAVATGQYVDTRRSFREVLRRADTIPIRYRNRSSRTRPIVVLCDISGSMDSYSRMFLHFMQALGNDRERVHGFVFGTRLTNVTRHLKYRDIDIALSAISENVEDWAGGTRIGECIRQFNQGWSRRVLGSGAIVLLVTDGLERDDAGKLERQMERLSKSCYKLVWLNPLLRYDQFQPRAMGVRAILPRVDEFRPVHNLHSFDELVETLSQDSNRPALHLH